MTESDRIRVLLADNDDNYRRTLVPLLHLEGYDTLEAAAVDDAIQLLRQPGADLALIDLCLVEDGDPRDVSGLEVAKSAAELGIPAIIVTSYGTVGTTRIALRYGEGRPIAVDYVPKSEGPYALLETVRAVLARRNSRTSGSVGALQIDLVKGIVQLKGSELRLSRKQYALLANLYRAGGAVCSTHGLIEAVYGERVLPEEASAHKPFGRLVARLREKIEDDPKHPKLLLTVPGRGLRLNM